MNPAKRPNLFGWLICLALALSACLPATPAPTEAPLPTLTPTPGIPTAIPLPADLAAIDYLSLVLIDFQDALNGWALASSDTGYAETHEASPGYLLRTQDGGSTWLDVTPPGLAEVRYTSYLEVLDVNTVWALIPQADFQTGTLYHSRDGGLTWTSNPVPFGGGVLQFLDPSTGIALADRGAGAGSHAVEILQTADGGVTWTSVFHNDPSLPGAGDSLPLGGVKNGMTFLTPSTGWITGTRPVDGEIYLFLTRDGGASWSLQPVPLPAGFASNQYMPFAPIFFGQAGILPLMIYAPGGEVSQVVYTSGDGGATWTGDPADARQVIPPGDISFADALTGFSWNGGEAFYFTRDGGLTWSSLTPSLDLSDSLNCIDFVDAGIGWALTGPFDSGLTWLYQTRDGGATWTQIVPQE